MRAQGVVLGGAVYLAIACGSACGGNQTTAPWGDDAGTSNGGSSGSSSGYSGGSGGSNGSGSGSGSGSPSGSNSGSGSGSGGGGNNSSSSSGGGNGSSSGSPSGSSTSGSSSGGGSSSSSGGSSGSSSGGPSSGANPPDCSTANLNWAAGNETVFESYPPQGSAECIQYSGCMYEGQFAACSKTVSQQWVMTHNIFSVFTKGNALSMYQYHWICLKDGSGNTIAGLALDTCADSDCSGCCTQNLGNASMLIDVEINTDAQFGNLGINGGQSVQWADYGLADPSAYAGCN